MAKLKLLIRASQCSLHNAPIFRLLLKVAVNGTHQCESLNFCGTLVPTFTTMAYKINSVCWHVLQHAAFGLGMHMHVHTVRINSMYAEVAWPMLGLCKVSLESKAIHDICRGLINLPGWCWAEIQQFALVGSSSSLHSEACNALGASDGVIHSRISQEVVCF